MSSESSTSGSGGIGFGGALFLVFLVLKLTHVVDWSWWWITAPLWGGLVLFVVIFGIAFLVVEGLAARRRARQKARRR